MSRSIRSSLLTAVVVATVAYSSPLSTNPYYTAARPPIAIAPFHEPEAIHGHIDNSYLVVLKKDTPVTLIQNHMNFLQAAHEQSPLQATDSGLRHIYDSHILKGYAGSFSDEVVSQIRSMPEVELVERDQVVRTTDFNATEITVQKGAPWGLARVSNRDKLAWSTFTKYSYVEGAGSGVDVYVIDTGINIHHVEFEGRASWGKTIPQNDVDEDGNGHGTHCAGTIASAKYGVAKKANVIAVKVLGSNGSGSMSDVVAGVEFAALSAKAQAAAADAEVKATGKTSHKGSTANMSLGGGQSRALDTAVNAAVDGGLHFAVAAGNENTDACKSSPAAADKVITVGASTLGDERAYFSNYGKCVDVFGPGLNILSTWNTGPASYATLSGTSMASPHVAGLLAYLLSIYPSQTFDPSFDSLIPAQMESQRAFSFYTVAYRALPRFISDFLPSPTLVESVTAPIPSKPIGTTELKQALIDLSTKGVLTDLPKDTVNYLIFNNATA